MQDAFAEKLDAELKAAGLALPEAEQQNLLPVWVDNLDRRTRLRFEKLQFGEVPFDGFDRDVTKWRRPAPSAATSPSFSGARVGDLCDLSLTEQSALLNTGAISSVELVESCLNCITRYDDFLRAFVTVDAAGARRSAEKSDAERRAGNSRGPLHGIPIAIKDNIAVGGMPLTAGSLQFASKISPVDANIVARLREHGAIVLGTNTLMEFGAGPPVREGRFATGRNPWDPSRIPGGSSSGSAVAVAAGMCSAALGTDTAGSVRMPASFTGLVGLKPTRGRVSLRGVVPLCWSLDTVGTLTRSVDDAALILDAIAHDCQTGRSFLSRIGASLKGVRLGVLRRGFVNSADVRDDVRSSFEAALDVLRQLGVITEDIELPTTAWSDVIYTTLLSEAYSLHATLLQQHPDAYTDWLRTQLYAGALVASDDVARARRLQGRMVGEALAALDRVDAFVLPGQAEPAPVFSTSLRPALTQPRSRFTRPWNVTGFPVLAHPCGFSDEGMPLSLHLVGRPYDEAMLFQLGCAYQGVTTWHQQRPDSAKWTESQDDDQLQTGS